MADLVPRPFWGIPGHERPGADCTGCGKAALLSADGTLYTCPDCGVSAARCTARFARKECQYPMHTTSTHESYSGSTWPDGSGDV